MSTCTSSPTLVVPGRGLARGWSRHLFQPHVDCVLDHVHLAQGTCVVLHHPRVNADEMEAMTRKKRGGGEGGESSKKVAVHAGAACYPDATHLHGSSRVSTLSANSSKQIAQLSRSTSGSGDLLEKGSGWRWIVSLPVSMSEPRNGQTTSAPLSVAAAHLHSRRSPVFTFVDL